MKIYTQLSKFKKDRFGNLLIGQTFRCINGRAVYVKSGSGSATKVDTLKCYEFPYNKEIYLVRLGETGYVRILEKKENSSKWEHECTIHCSRLEAETLLATLRKVQTSIRDNGCWGSAILFLDAWIPQLRRSLEED